MIGSAPWSPLSIVDLKNIAVKITVRLVDPPLFTTLGVELWNDVLILNGWREIFFQTHEKRERVNYLYVALSGLV